MVEDLFGITPDEWQAEALMSLAQEDHVTIRSGHGVGKSALMSWAILWWMFTRYPCKVACTAPTSHQLNDVLWGEIAKWRERLPESWKRLITVKSDRIELISNPLESFAVARTARKEQPEAFQGFHSDNMLFIVDEASGVEDVIFEVGSGSMSTKGAKTLMAGNPTRSQGYFHDSFTKMRDDWHTIQVSCETSKMVSQEWVNRMKKQYGEDSDVYRVRVLGDFPQGDDNTVIPLYLLESAINRDVKVADGKVVWGVDIARFGKDKSALAKRKKNHLIEPVMTWQGKDLMQSTGIIVKEYEKTRFEDKPDMILVDSIGLGSGVVDRLREQGYPARGINVAESPSIDSDKYARLRDELWWKARDWFEQKDVVLPNQDELISDLATPTFEILSSGKIKVESKSDIKKRLPRSPDVADAFCLTFAVSDRKFTSKPHYRKLGIV